MPDLTAMDVTRLVSAQRSRNQEMMSRMRIRRHLINRDNVALGSNETGTFLPPPFDKTVVAIRTMIGETSKAVQHYTTRIGANKPEISVVPLMMRDSVSTKAQRTAGLQERFDNTLWEENGGDQAQGICSWAQTVTGAGYYLTLPRDATFGLPDRIMYDEDDAQIMSLMRDGKISPVRRKLPSGKMVYVEAGDVWAARRKEHAQKMFPGRQLFSLRAFPRDMVLREKDADGIKWAAVMEEIPATLIGAGSEIGYAAAKTDGIPPENWGRYGLWRGKGGSIEGGITIGQPIHSGTSENVNLVRFFNRHEQIIIITGGSEDGGRIVYRGKHGCTVQGVPACPVVEVPFITTDTNNAGQEFSTPMEQIFAYVPIINQLITQLSNAVAYNLIPRWIIELADPSSDLRGVDGEPQKNEHDYVPGLDPAQATAIPGKLQQMKIDTTSANDLLKFYEEHLASVMPAPVMSGVSGTSAPAWQVHQLIQQGQQSSQPAVNNHADAVRDIILMWHGWLRQLDVPVGVYAAPGRLRNEKASAKYLIEFDPKDLTDSIVVHQELTTDEEAIVRVQVGLELRASGSIDDMELMRDYMRKQDPEQAIIDKYVQQVVDHVMGGIPAAPGSVIQIVADGVRGQLNYQLLQMSPNYAIASAEGMAMQAMQPQGQMAQPGQFPSDAGQPNVADQAGVAIPGMGLNPSLGGQLGGNKPGVRAPVA